MAIKKKNSEQKGSLSKDEIIAELWRRGNLFWLLRPEQQIIYNHLRGASGGKYTLYCSRRFGKTHICTLMSMEDALQGPSREVGFAAPKQKQIKRIIMPIMNKLLESCPKDIRPKFDREVSGWVFKNGSIIYASGTDNKNYEDLRGMNLYRGYVDEPGTCDDLDIIVNSILFPQTLTSTRTHGAAIVLLGTPSPTPAHPFFFMKEQCKSQGNYAKMTIMDNSSLDADKREEYIKEAGGRDHHNCRREYFCEDITDTSRAIIPEFTDERADLLTIPEENPPHFSYYGGLDPAYNDFTAYLVGYYNFLGGYYYIRGEKTFHEATSQTLCAKIKELEAEVFPNKNPELRVSDTASQVIADLNLLHGLEFCPTRKDDKEAQLNNLRVLVGTNKIKFHPDCKVLLRQMKCGIWNRSKTKFERIEGEGHFDTIDALIYLIRNIDKFDNPYPGARYTEDQFVKQEQNTLEGIFQ